MIYTIKCLIILNSNKKKMSNNIILPVFNFIQSTKNRTFISEPKKCA